MQMFDAWMFPDGETHIPAWMATAKRRVDGRLTYQYHKYEVALAECTERRVAVDVGAHVGLWSYWMARDFRTVHAFEPNDLAAACWAINMEAYPSARLHPIALGAHSDLVALERSVVSSGNTRVLLNVPDASVPMCRLDTFAFEDVDLLKVDCEGFDYFVIAGARDTIQRCRPVVVVEQKGRYGRRYGCGEQEAVDLLESLGARRVANLGGDFVMSFKR